MTFKEIEKILLKDGWKHVDTRGSHYQYKHPTKPGKVTVPHHKGDINIKTVNSILKAAGLKQGGQHNETILPRNILSVGRG